MKMAKSKYVFAPPQSKLSYGSGKKWQALFNSGYYKVGQVTAKNMDIAEKIAREKYGEYIVGLANTHGYGRKMEVAKYPFSRNSYDIFVKSPSK